MTKKMIVLGVGGNCFDIVDAVQLLNKKQKQYDIVGFLDDDDAVRDNTYSGIHVLGKLVDAGRYADCCFVNGIGSPSSFAQKSSIIAQTGIPNSQFETIVHPTAVVSPSAVLNTGAVLLANVTVCANASVGHLVMVLPGCTISHDCRIQDNAILASGVTLCGAVQVGAGSYLGANSVVRGDIVVGENSLVGAGSVVIQHVSPQTVVAGNPARLLRSLV